MSSSPTQRALIERAELCNSSRRIDPVITQYSPVTAAALSPPASVQQQQTTQQCFGKASSVASQNLSIIVEAINHLEGDQRVSAHHISQHKVYITYTWLPSYSVEELDSYQKSMTPQKQSGINPYAMLAIDKRHNVFIYV